MEAFHAVTGAAPMTAYHSKERHQRPTGIFKISENIGEARRLGLVYVDSITFWSGYASLGFLVE